MGVIQSNVNQAIGAAGQAASFVKFLSNQKKIGDGVKEAGDNALYTDEQKRNARDEALLEMTEEQKRERYAKIEMTEEQKRERYAKIEMEEKEKLIAKIREQMLRERERQSFNERQSTKSKIRNQKDLKEHERLRNSPLGGDFNV